MHAHCTAYFIVYLEVQDSSCTRSFPLLLRFLVVTILLYYTRECYIIMNKFYLVLFGNQMCLQDFCHLLLFQLEERKFFIFSKGESKANGFLSRFFLL